MNQTEWVSVYVTQGRLSAEMVRLLLESINIQAILSQESVGITYGLTVGDLGEVEILVPYSQVDAANEILRAMEEGKLEADPSDAENLDNPDDSPKEDYS